LTRDLRPGHLDPDRFFTNMQFEHMKSLQRIRFEGDYGDIMMHPRARDLLSRAASITTVEAITNGSMRTEKWWRELADIADLEVTFSIDGLADTNSIYRINSDFDRIMTNARTFIQAGGSAHWKYLVFRHNQHQVDAAQQLARDMGFRSFYVQHTDRSWFQGPVWPVHRDGQYLYNIAPSDQVQQIRPDPVRVALTKHTSERGGITCQLTRTHDIYVNFMGYVLPCCMTSGQTWRQNLEARLWRRIVGDLDSININLRSVSEILAGDFYRARLSRSLQGQDITHPLCIANCA